MSEHQAYDVVAIEDNGTAFRLQVKYASLKRNGVIAVSFRRNWADRNGTHTAHYKQEEFDYYAIYCPEEDLVLYVRNGPNCPKAIRFKQTGNRQVQNIKWFRDYLELARESSETIRCTPETAMT